MVMDLNDTSTMNQFQIKRNIDKQQCPIIPHDFAYIPHTLCSSSSASSRLDIFTLFKFQN